MLALNVNTVQLLLLSSMDDLPSRIVLTASGTRPPFQLRVLMPNDTAWAKLSCPRRIPVKRACQVSIDHMKKKRASGHRIYVPNSEMLSVMVETK